MDSAHSEQISHQSVCVRLEDFTTCLTEWSRKKEVIASADNMREFHGSCTCLRVSERTSSAAESFVCSSGVCVCSSCVCARMQCVC